MPKLNWNMVATLVVAAIIVFLLQKYLTRIKVSSDGTQSRLVGFGGGDDFSPLF